MDPDSGKMVELPAGQSVTPHQKGPFLPATQKSGVLPNKRHSRALVDLHRPQSRLLSVTLGATEMQVHYFWDALLKISVWIFCIKLR